MKWYLDFGHGGKDSGALGSNKTKESDTVLKIGMLIKNNLEKNNEKITEEIEQDNKAIKEESNKIKGKEEKIT